MIPLLLFIQTAVSAERVQEHLIVGDVRSACAEAEAVALRYPDEIKSWQSLIAAFAASGDEKKMLDAWCQLNLRFKEKSFELPVLETMAWSVIRQGSFSSSPYLRILSILGAWAGQDAEGVKILNKLLSDSNKEVRRVAAEISGTFKDRCLIEKLKKMAISETDWQVRLAAISSLGKMGEESFLFSLLERGSLTFEEKEVVFSALIEKISPQNIESLAKSQNPGLRELAAQAIGFNEMKGQEAVLISLINDPHPDVRVSSYRSIGKLDIKSTAWQAPRSEFDPRVQIARAWALVLANNPEGELLFSKLLEHPHLKTKCEAAAALSTVGNARKHLIQKAFMRSENPFVKINLWLGLLGERCDVEGGCVSHFSLPKERMMFSRRSGFRAIVPSTVTHNPMVTNLPEVEDQMVRLELLSSLVILGDAKAEQEIAGFLENTHWGMTASSSALLLTEGSKLHAEAVTSLLNHPNSKVRIQAALILALWGKGDEPCAVLMQEYPAATREMKERILEGLGRIASANVIPFLTEQLKSQHQSLRIIASGSLLKCLYG